MKVWTVTDTGCVRTENEDALYAGKLGDGSVLLIVADGMGGHEHGEVAARMAVDCVREKMEQACDEDRGGQLCAAISYAGNRIIANQTSDQIRCRMGTTVTCAVVDGLEVTIGHIGDSRAYLFSDGKLKRLTVDHSFAGELERKSGLTEEEIMVHPKRGLLTRSLGIGEPKPDIIDATLAGGDLLLLCSDGLTGVVTSDEISDVLSDGVDNPANSLCQLALDRGGPDNVTVVVALCNDSDEIEVLTS